MTTPKDLNYKEANLLLNHYRATGQDEKVAELEEWIDHRLEQATETINATMDVLNGGAQ